MDKRATNHEGCPDGTHTNPASVAECLVVRLGKYFRISVGILPMVAFACGETAPVDPVVAEIGGEPVTLLQFESYVRSVSEEDIPLVGGELKSALLDQLVEELLLLRAAEEAGVVLSPAEVRAMETENPLVSEVGQSAAREALDRNPLDLAARLKIKKLMDTVILQDVVVTDEEIEAHYEENRVYYKRPAGVDISQILLETEAQASELLVELSSDGSRFEELAEEHSVGPEASEGGYLGTFRRGELPTVFEAEVFELSRGGLSGVVQTDFGFHIFRANETYPAEDLSLDEVTDMIRVELLRQKSDEAFALFLDDLRKRHPVRIDTEQLDFPYLNQSGYDIVPRAGTEATGAQNAGH